MRDANTVSINTKTRLGELKLDSKLKSLFLIKHLGTTAKPAYSDVGLRKLFIYLISAFLAF